METKVITEMWGVGHTDDNCAWINDSNLDVVAKVYSGDSEDAPTHDQNAKLIVTAVNACKTINPDNPLAATKAIKLLFDNFERIIDRVEENELQNNFPSSYERAKAALKQATE